MTKAIMLVVSLLCALLCWAPVRVVDAFAPVAFTRATTVRESATNRAQLLNQQQQHHHNHPLRIHIRMMMSSEGEPSATTEKDPMEEEMEVEMDEATRTAIAKSKRADELRSQEVFMKKSTGKHKCTNCDWEFDVDKGDSMMIGGQIKPGTTFVDLPSNWRCPVCRASKDSFAEVVLEIPGFEVNQGYGFGTNSWTSDQKNIAIFGGLALFALLFLSGYAMS
jgi:rubredoxin